jgi:hypothetical protein
MPVQFQGNGGTVAEVGGSTFKAVHMHPKPLEYGALGHYSFAVRIASTAAQAANSRLLEIRNSGTNLIIPTRITMRAIQTAAGTAQENSIDCYKCTSFTVVDTTNTVTPTTSVKKTSGMSAFPGNAQVRHLTLAGAAAGMTGGTLTKDTQAFATLPYNVAAAINTTTIWGPLEAAPRSLDEHPFVFAQNEGFIIENRVLNVTSYGITWYLDVAWAEVGSF